MYIHIYVYMYIYICLYKHIYLCNIHTNMDKYICIICAYLYLYNINLPVYAHIYVNIYIYLCICAHICIHTLHKRTSDSPDIPTDINTK